MPTTPQATRLPDGRLPRIQGTDVLLSDFEQHKRADLQRRDELLRWTRPDPEWHRALLRESQQAGNSFAASFHLDRLIHWSPIDATLHVQQAHALARLGQPSQAATHLMHALFLHPRVNLQPVHAGPARRGQ
jgi:hypothetical protein